MNLNLGNNYSLQNDINCSATKSWNDGNGFMPIGSSANKFTGVLDGNNKTVSNLFINRPSMDNVGLIGWAGASSSVIDLSLKDANITGQYNVGSFFGALESKVDGSYAGSNLSVVGDFVAVYGGYPSGWGCGNSFGIDPVNFNPSNIIPLIPLDAAEGAYGN